MAEMASLPAAVARAAARAAAVAVNPFTRPVVDAVARATNASKRPAVASPISPLRAPLVTGTSNEALPSLAAAAAAVAAANTAPRAEENKAAANVGDAWRLTAGPRCLFLSDARYLHGGPTEVGASDCCANGPQINNSVTYEI
jgi:hypothetical protein